ncbi:uncharacterized protein MELLADRAFT_49933 [Melampsora larici-populina 98AG31]|uniref:DNA repair protein RAD50 n=1 Tax=Melampsora larici-populina (strain 98AG31 / pathotype 3-4-7) TaxID=747676 RepID=F4S037_MELLP|nr:uncharacterized protein MELLADRAFT_49933 [Melampsora larici-populina 98AG31]EGG01897.1 hypothetical protein MELLADRAFT_49933 [Melampsora larici-populina 98AG31]
MSTIDKIAIRGIRSFDHEQMAVMQFYSPLTVIVGHNGSGKTTIIECLKYITTGDLPPNAKGGAFVHDPSMAGESTVMAEVMLRFRNAAGTKLVASRRLQVSKKKTAGITMKTLEGTLSYNDDGREGSSAKRRTISTKCAEMDIELPRQLGISKAILENVIFCHQEESNWPLSEPASLKKKFDEIFEATKYTKALDNLKLIKKEATADLKVDKERYSALATDKARAEKLQAGIDKIKANIEKKEERYDDLDAQIAGLAEDNKKFYEQAVHYKEILNEYETLSRQKDNREEMVQDLLEGMEEIAATDEDLRNSREESRAKLENHAERLQDTKDQLASLELEIAKLRRRHQNKFTELGQLKAQTQRHVSALEERQDLVRHLSEHHQIKGFEGPIDERQVEEFLNTLTESQKRCSSELEQVKPKKRSKKRSLNTRRRKARIDKRNKLCRNKLCDTTRKRVRKLTEQIERVKISEHDLKDQTDSLKQKQDRLTELTKWMTQSQADNRIKTKNDEIKKLEDEKDELHSELSGLHRQFDTRAKLALKRTDAKKKNDGIHTIIESHGPKFKELVKTEMTLENAETDIGNALRDIERQSRDTESVNATAARNLQTVDTKLQMNKAKTKSLERELYGLEKKIKDAADGETVSQSISIAETEILSLNSELDIIKYSVRFHQNLLAKAKKGNNCGACQREFGDAQEMQRFERFVSSILENESFKKLTSIYQSELKEWQEQLERMKNLLPDELAVNKLRETELPSLEEELKELESKWAASSHTSEDARRDVERLKDQMSELMLCKRSVIDMTRMRLEADDLEREIQRLEFELENSGSTKTSEVVEAQLEALTTKLAEVRKEVNSLVTERDNKRASIQVLENQIHQIELDLNNKRQQIKEREGFEKQKEESRTEIAQLDEMIKKIDEHIRTFAEPISRLENELKELSARNSGAELEVVKKVQMYNKSLNQIETINREIAKFVESGIETSMQRCQGEIDRLEQLIKQATQMLAESQQTLIDLDQESTKAKEFERNISDNIRLRAHRDEIAGLESALQELDVEGAREANRKYDEEYHKARKLQADFQADHARLGGEIGMDRKNLKDKKSEMDVEFKDIFNRHRNQLIKVKTVEIANQDLDKYAKALDQAIMKYHSHKMAEINDTIQTLWQKTYQGTDIDKILIKSENENAKSNRSYNYRVVMLKDQVEMDMRGRCSAGQKVLASIIIRLALAESFGTNCGILALDEPTTNLDKDNINALANALSEIIKERRDQANFQLVVITHDEDFLNQLGQSDVLDKYWRVSRNTQQKSIIERQRLM